MPVSSKRSLDGHDLFARATLAGCLMAALVQTAAADCPPEPSQECRGAVEDGGSRIDLRARDDERSVSWRYTKGAATTKSELGNPPASTSYALCVYDADGTLISHAAMPAGAGWRETTRGWRYSDDIVRATLKSGGDRQARMLVKADDPSLVAPVPPIAEDALPLSVQLVSSDGGCWGGLHADTRRNRDGSFQAAASAQSATTTTTSTTTTTIEPSLDTLTDLVAPYGDADGDGFANAVELASCSNPADAASTPLNDSSLCTNQTVFSDTLGPAWGGTNRLTDPTYHVAVDALVAHNLAECSAYCATTTDIGSPQACEGAWPWSGVPEYAVYASGRTVEVNFPDEDGYRLEGRLFLPPGVECSSSLQPVCDGMTDTVTCTDPLGRSYSTVAICDGFIGVQRMYWWAAQRLAEQGYIAMTFDVSGQGLSQGQFPNGDAGIAADIPGGGGGFARDIGAALNFLVSSANPVRNLMRVEPATIVNQGSGEDHVEPYVIGVAGHSMGATAAIAYQQSTEAAYPVRARAVVAWSHFDAENTIGNVPIQLHSGDEDNGFIQPPGSGNRGPEMQKRYDRLAGDRDLDGAADFVPNDRQIIMTSEGTHLDYSKVPWAYVPTWAEELEYHYTLAWFDRYLSGDVRRTMTDAAGGVIQSADRYGDYQPCSSGSDCYSATERLEMSHLRLSDVWCSRYSLGSVSDADMKGAGCATE